MHNIKLVGGYRALKSADISFEEKSVLLLSGSNGSGKSSLSEAIRALQSSQQSPIPGLKASDIKLLVNEGAKGGKAEITISNDAGSRSLKLPSKKFTQKGEAKELSVFASGYEKFTSKKPAERSQALFDILKAHPTREMIETEFGFFIDDEKKLQAIVDKVDAKDGFDDTLEEYAGKNGKRIQQKRAWSEVTGINYGSDKAESYYPEGWDDSLESSSIESLTTELSDAQLELENSIRGDAISQSGFNDMREQADSSEILKAEMPAKNKRLSEINKELEELNIKLSKPPESVEKWQTIKPSIEEIDKELESLPVPAEESNSFCPHCNKDLIIRGTTANAVKSPDPKLLEKRVELEAKKALIMEGLKEFKDNELARYKKSFDETTLERQTLFAEYSKMMAGLELAEKAKLNLKKVFVETEDKKAEVENMRTLIRNVESKINAFNSKTKADSIHAELEKMERIIALLKPEGIRFECMQKAMKPFENLLKKVSYGNISIDEDFEVYFKDHPYLIVSTSQKWLCDIIIQFCFAIMEKADFVIIDAADKLDARYEGICLQICKMIPLAVVICSTQFLSDDKELKRVEIENPDGRSGVI